LLFVLVAPAARAQTVPADNAGAKAAFVEGERSFQLGKFEAAIDAYERAFGLDPQPAFLFNIALSQRRQYEIDGRIDRLARARELYRNYLKLEPQSTHRAGVEKLIAELTTKLEAARGKAGAAPPPPTAPAPSAPTPATAAPASPPAAPPPTPATASPAAVLAASAGEGEPARSASRKWILGGTIAAAAVVAVVAIFFATRGGPEFDGPGVDLMPQ
jgi:hypothetical protein